MGQPVVVELTNDDVMRGTLEGVDEGMNLSLNGGVKWTRKGTSEPRAVLRGEEEEEEATTSTTENPFFAPSLHVRGRRIRFVHLPPSVDPSTVVDKARENIAASRAAYRREMLTKAHGGGRGRESGARSKGRDAEQRGGGGEGSAADDDDDDDDDEGDQYYYEDFDDDDEEDEEGQ